MKITKVTFEITEKGGMEVIPIAYCLEPPKVLFKYSNKPVFLVTECNDYGDYICDSIYKWDSIKSINEVEAKEHFKETFNIKVDK